MSSAYDILVGMNGAGLINALYLHPTGVAIQLLPNGSNLNFDEFRSLLRARGLYREWKSSVPPPASAATSGVDPRDPTSMTRGRHHKMNEDTEVDTAEFRGLLSDAMCLLRVQAAAGRIQALAVPLRARPPTQRV